MTNLERVRRELERKELDALLVTQIDNVGWMSGFTGSNGFIIVTPADVRFITDARYTLQSKEQLPGTHVEIYTSGTDVWQFLSEQVQAMGISRLGFEADTTSYAAYQKIQSKFGGIELVPIDDFFGNLRLVKTADEVEKIRVACKLADQCFDHVLRMIQPGVSEYDISLDIEFFFRRAGAGLSFEPIVVSGERSAFPHGRASEKKLERGDFLTLDFGAQVDGYCSDITRTVVVGEASDRHRQIYQAVLDAQIAALEAMKPGVAAKDVDRVSRESMGELAQYFGHGLGHGLGRLVHDAGRLSASSTDVLVPGQVWTVEPGIYIPGFGGCRIENDVVITEHGIDVLDTSTKELLILS